MVNYLVFDDEIVLYWDREYDLAERPSYKIFLDGKEIFSLQKSHCFVCELLEKTTYKIEIKRVTKTDEVIVFSKEITTLTKKNKIDVTKSPYNAVGDGSTLNTSALQKAIDDCGTNDCVYIPEGTFLTGALNFHSNMELYVEEDAVLQGTSDLNDYLPKIKSRFEGIEMMCYRSLINMGELDRDGGYNCENVVIRGKGSVFGGGRKLAENTIEYEKKLLKEYLEQNAEYVATCEFADTIPGRSRGRLINMSNCKNIIIGNVALGFGPSWNVHMIYSSDIITYGCTFRSKNIWNGDGWDPDSSKNCTLFGCEFFTGDDAVAIKSGKNPEGNIINRPCEHIKVFDCVSCSGHGITIGSEMSGGVNDVSIWNCDLRRSILGIQIKSTKKRGGFVKNLHVSDCDVARILLQSVPYNDDGIAAPTVPVFEDFLFEDINVAGAFVDHDGNGAYCNPIEITGFDMPGYFIKKIKFKNLTIDAPQGDNKYGIIIQRCNDITFENVCCKY